MTEMTRKNYQQMELRLSQAEELAQQKQQLNALMKERDDWLYAEAERYRNSNITSPI